MTTDRQIAANRQNAQKSTGPRTPEGKAKSALNALKHGLRARTLVLPETIHPGESAGDFAELLDALVAELKPSGALEETCVETIAVALWRFRRALRAENGEIARRYQIAPSNDPARAARASLPDTDRLNAIVRYEGHIQRQLERALRQLAAIRDARSLREKLRQRQEQVAARLNDPDLFSGKPDSLPDPATFYGQLAADRSE